MFQTVYSFTERVQSFYQCMINAEYFFTMCTSDKRSLFAVCFCTFITLNSFAAIINRSIEWPWMIYNITAFKKSKTYEIFKPFGTKLIVCKRLNLQKIVLVPNIDVVLSYQQCVCQKPDEVFIWTEEVHIGRLHDTSTFSWNQSFDEFYVFGDCRFIKAIIFIGGPGIDQQKDIFSSNQIRPQNLIQKKPSNLASTCLLFSLQML